MTSTIPGIPADSAHAGHDLVYAEYGWTYRPVVGASTGEGTLDILYDREAADQDVTDTALICMTCDRTEVRAEDLDPDAELWYGEPAPEDGRSPWDEIDGAPVEDWQYEVANGDTRLGYLAWADAKKEQEGTA